MSWIDEILKFGADTVLATEYVDDDIAKSRMTICRSCVYRVEGDSPENDKCGACGCYLDIKTKCKYNRSKKRPNGEITHCPRGYWDDLEITNYYRQLDGLELLK